MKHTVYSMQYMVRSWKQSLSSFSPPTRLRRSPLFHLAISDRLPQGWEQHLDIRAMVGIAAVLALLGAASLGRLGVASTRGGMRSAVEPYEYCGLLVGSMSSWGHEMSMYVYIDMYMSVHMYLYAWVLCP